VFDGFSKQLAEIRMMLSGLSKKVAVA